MNERFSMDHGILGFLTKVFDVIFLSILWVLFCIPIVTIGPATTALYYTSAKVIRKERGYVWHEFWHAFKSNFVQGAIYTVILAAILAIFYFGFGVTQEKKDDIEKIIRYAYILIAFFVACGYVFVFPILSRFSMKTFQMLKMSFLISLKHLPSTVGLLIMLLAAGTVLFYFLPLVVILPSIIALLSTFLIEPVLKKYLPAPEEGVSEDDLKWYQTF